MKCRLDNFSMSFILFYVNLSICENKKIAVNMWDQFKRAPHICIISLSESEDYDI